VPIGMAQVLRQVLRIGLKIIWVGEQPVVKLSTVALKTEAPFQERRHERRPAAPTIALD